MDSATARVSRWYVPCQCSSALKSACPRSPSLSPHCFPPLPCSAGVMIWIRCCCVELGSHPPPLPPARSVSHTGPLADRHLVSAVCLSVRFEIELCPRISLMSLSLSQTHRHTDSLSGLNNDLMSCTFKMSL